MQYAIMHSNAFAEVYNEQVVANMKRIMQSFPDKMQLLRDSELQAAGFSELLAKSREDQELRNQIKDCLQSTQRYKLAMIG